MVLKCNALKKEKIRWHVYDLTFMSRGRGDGSGSSLRFDICKCDTTGPWDNFQLSLWQQNCVLLKEPSKEVFFSACP